MLKNPAASVVVFYVLSGCSCASSGGCPALGGNRGPVFLGAVLAVEDLAAAGDEMFLNQRKARIQVREALGGLPPDVREVDVFTGRGGGDCGIPFEAGEIYLIDADVGKDGRLHAGICSSSRRIDDAGVALRILRARRDGRAV